ncbi:MAG: hypothetical protein PUB19_04565 [Lachnospiraceae bacterium]|nr:hypothetical protein [Lachnospiraceae bacterium]
MKKIVPKHILLLSLMISIGFTLSGCGNKNSIDGLWVSGDGVYSVSFDRDNTIVVDGKYIGEYNIYDKGKMAINVDTETFDDVLDITMSAGYTIDDGILTITDLERGQSYIFYTQKKLEELNNKTYNTLYKEFDGIRDFSSYESLGHFDKDGKIIKEFNWESEESNDTIANFQITAKNLFMEEVFPLYKNANPNAKYHVYPDSLIGSNGAILNEIELRCEGPDTISIIDRFAIEPKDKLIYVWNAADDSFKLWDGTIISGKSLFDR